MTDIGNDLGKPLGGKLKMPLFISVPGLTQRFNYVELHRSFRGPTISIDQLYKSTKGTRRMADLDKMIALGNSIFGKTSSVPPGFFEALEAHFFTVFDSSLFNIQHLLVTDDLK